MNNPNLRNENIIPEFTTLAALDDSNKLYKSNVSMPSAQAVTDAKDWVDANEK